MECNIYPGDAEGAEGELGAPHWTDPGAADVDSVRQPTDAETAAVQAAQELAEHYTAYERSLMRGVQE